MRGAVLAGAMLIAVLPAAAQNASGPATAASVPVCDSLLALRQLAADAGEDRGRAAETVSRHPNCRLLPRGDIGEVQRRAVFGGGVYECAALTTGGCAWVMP